MRPFYCNPDLFWDWFIKHHEKYKYPSRLSAKEYQHWETELHSKLSSLCFELVFADITCDEPNSWAHLLVSAHGDSKKFEKLEVCMEAAPAIEGWRFEALYPPMPAEACMRHNYPSITTRPDELWFSPLELKLQGGRYNLQLYVSESVPVSWEIKGAATQMMFTLLGEKIGGLFVRKVAVSHLEKVTPEVRPTLLPMPKLPEYIKPDGHAGMSINEQGGIIKPGGKQKPSSS